MAYSIYSINNWEGQVTCNGGVFGTRNMISNTGTGSVTNSAIASPIQLQFDSNSTFDVVKFTFEIKHSDFDTDYESITWTFDQYKDYEYQVRYNIFNENTSPTGYEGGNELTMWSNGVISLVMCPYQVSNQFMEPSSKISSPTRIFIYVKHKYKDITERPLSIKMSIALLDKE